MASSAIAFNNDLLKENWRVKPSSSTITKEAKVSYLMVEQVEPPKYMWDKICKILDAEKEAETKTNYQKLSNKTIKALLITGGLITITSILLFLL